MATQHQSSTTKTMLATLAGIVGSGTSMSIGASYGTEEGAWLAFWLACAVLAPISIYGVLAEQHKDKVIGPKLAKYRNSLAQLTSKYNMSISSLESQYLRERQSLGLFSAIKKEGLRQQYEQTYYSKRNAYQMERAVFKSAFEKATPENARMKHTWIKIFAIGFITLLSACGFSAGALTEEEPTSISSAVASNEEVRYWNIETIPMPHLTDGSRYVSNPDNVVTANTEALLNQMLKRMDDSLQIESSMVIVRHVENRDIFRFAQDIFDRYHVGKNDRGLVVVLAYDDHLVRTHTGRSLEGDLTDIECSRLQETYLIPCVKAEMPDSGMLYLTEAIYQLLQKKEMPVMTALSSSEEEDPFDKLFGLYLLLFVGWGAFAFYIANRYGVVSVNTLRSNPFARSVVYASSGGGSHIGGGGGGGFSGGGFSGGSSGGGGATSSW